MYFLFTLSPQFCVLSHEQPLLVVALHFNTKTLFPPHLMDSEWGSWFCSRINASLWGAMAHFCGFRRVKKTLNLVLLYSIISWCWYKKNLQPYFSIQLNISNLSDSIVSVNYCIWGKFSHGFVLERHLSGLREEGAFKLSLI